MKKPFIIHPSPASRQDAKRLEKRRFKAEKLFTGNIHQAEVARRLRVSRAAVHYWYITWRKKGKDGLRSRRPGPKPRLTQENLVAIQQALRKGPEVFGYGTNLWTLARVAEVIKRQARISYGTSQTWYLLRSLGWSNQKPETRYRDRNETAIRAWKEKRWPAIQKRGRIPMPA